MAYPRDLWGIEIYGFVSTFTQARTELQPPRSVGLGRRRRHPWTVRVHLATCEDASRSVPTRLAATTRRRRVGRRRVVFLAGRPADKTCSDDNEKNDADDEKNNDDGVLFGTGIIAARPARNKSTFSAVVQSFMYASVSGQAGARDRCLLPLGRRCNFRWRLLIFSFRSSQPAPTVSGPFTHSSLAVHLTNVRTQSPSSSRTFAGFIDTECMSRRHPTLREGVEACFVTVSVSIPLTARVSDKIPFPLVDIVTHPRPSNTSSKGTRARHRVGLLPGLCPLGGAIRCTSRRTILLRCCYGGREAARVPCEPMQVPA